MDIINIEKLVDYKILPFDLYDEAGNVIYSAGEVLTAGKILVLKGYDKLFRAHIQSTKENYDDTDNNFINQQGFYEEAQTVEEDFDHTIEHNDHAIIDTNISPIDTIDTQSYIGPVNINSLIDSKTQIKLKAFYSSIQKNTKQTTKKELIKNYLDLKDKIFNDISEQISKATFFSEIKLLGEYSKCHDLNVAILANAFGQKFGMDNDKIQELILAGLLHDIGKKYLPKDLLSKQSLTYAEKKQLASHTKIGYEIIKNQLKLPERIAKVALQHHEHTDGSGYPDKISEESIDLYSQIIGLCSLFDNLTFNKTEHRIYNVKDALRYIMSKCTKHYSSDILYTFVYMFSYNDVKNFEDMVM